MRNAMKVIVLVGALAIVAAGIGTATAMLTTPAVSTTSTPTGLSTTGADISGPCDELEHANDPECAGQQVPQVGPTPTSTPSGLDQIGDISGPCDEAEHVNDPRCTGAAGADEDNSGPGNRGGGDDEDRSGHGGGDDEDRSGHGGGDDEENEDEDNSGRG